MKKEIFYFLGNWYSENMSLILSYPENKFELTFIDDNSRNLQGNFEIYSDYLILKNNNNFSSITFKIIEMKENTFILENLSFDIGSKTNFKKGLYELRNIKQFELGDMIDISLQEFKEMVGIEEINLNRASDINGSPTKYYRYWNNTDRFCILLEEKTTKYLKENPNEKIIVYSKIKKTEKDFYTNFFITLYKGSMEEYNYNRDMKEIHYNDRFSNFEDDAFKSAFESNREVWDNYNLR